MCVVWCASKINARACILDIQSFERVAASKKPRVRSMEVSADAMGIEIVNFGLKGMVLRHFFFYCVTKIPIMQFFTTFPLIPYGEAGVGGWGGWEGGCWTWRARTEELVTLFVRRGGEEGAVLG